MFEQTIRSPIEFSGVGLHSGAPVSMCILPAPSGTGILFRRTDLDHFEVEAVGRNVAKVSYATSLMKKGVLISTTEHLLSAFIGTAIDNAIVEIDNLELPILDGSALPYLKRFSEVGLRQQRRHRTYMKIKQPVEVREGDKFIGVYPYGSYRVEYTIQFPHPLIQEQKYSVEIAGECYAREIAPARTFGFLSDEKKLHDMGLIRGASEENAIVLTSDGVNNGPLRFVDEFVRHKILDLIGDLALLGHHLRGRVVADRAGHAMHIALVAKLLRDHSLWEPVHLVGRGKEQEAARIPGALPLSAESHA